jgi:hypothetical protein
MHSIPILTLVLSFQVAIEILRAKISLAKINLEQTYK